MNRALMWLGAILTATLNFLMAWQCLAIMALLSGYGPTLAAVGSGQRRSNGNSSAALADGVVCIQKQVHEYLLHLADIGVDRGEAGLQVLDHLDPVQCELLVEKTNRPADHLIRIARSLLRFGLARKIEKTLDDLAAPLGLPHNDLELVANIGPILKPLQHVRAVGQHAREGIVNLVSDARRAPSYGSELVGLVQLTLCFRQRAHHLVEGACQFADFVRVPQSDRVIQVAARHAVRLFRCRPVAV